MDSRFKEGVIGEIGEEYTEIIIRKQSYKVSTVKHIVMLPPDLNTGDKVKAIIVKGDIRHLETIFNKDVPTKIEAPVLDVPPPKPKKKVIKSNLDKEFKIYSDKRAQKVYLFKCKKAVI